ncbi:unnamed protein product [Haemonchus placei]|uniref:Gag-pol polyprotein n=1 Tax=Haemonchus placei TaxID=6290 RepID=A0A0N4W873_HAEPC|nr:unnamed protein product [Haemonchus placei]
MTRRQNIAWQNANRGNTKKARTHKNFEDEDHLLKLICGNFIEDEEQDIIEEKGDKEFTTLILVPISPTTINDTTSFDKRADVSTVWEGEILTWNALKGERSAGIVE